MDYQLKSNLGLIYQFCDALDRTECVKQAGLPYALRKVVAWDFIKFLLYLAASSGTIRQSDADFVNDYFMKEGFLFTPEMVRDGIQKKNLDSTAFESEVPASLEFIVSVDNILYKGGHNIGNSSFPKFIVDTYTSLGLDFLECNDHLSGSETGDFKIYISMLRDYVTSESYRPDSLFDDDPLSDDDDEYDEDDGGNSLFEDSDEDDQAAPLLENTEEEDDEAPFFEESDEDDDAPSFLENSGGNSAVENGKEKSSMNADIDFAALKKQLIEIGFLTE